MLSCLLFSALSCSSEDDTKRETVKVNEDYSKFYVRSPQDASEMIDFNPLLVGIFEGECVNGLSLETSKEVFSVKELLEINYDGTARSISLGFFENDCKPLQIVFSLEVSLKDSKYDKIKDDKFSSLQFIDKIEFQAFNKVFVDYLKKDKFCEIDTWSKNEKQDISGKKCFEDNLVPSKAMPVPDTLTVTAESLTKSLSFNVAQMKDMDINTGSYTYFRKSELFKAEQKKQDSPLKDPDPKNPLPVEECSGDKDCLLLSDLDASYTSEKSCTKFNIKIGANPNSEFPLYRKSNFSINSEKNKGLFNESIYITETCDQATLLFVVDVPFELDIDQTFVSIDRIPNINKVDFTIGQATATIKTSNLEGAFNDNKVSNAAKLFTFYTSIQS